MNELIKLIFGETPNVVNNGSEGVDDDPFVTWNSPEEADLYA